jgi:hypothetical protein
MLICNAARVVAIAAIVALVQSALAEDEESLAGHGEVSLIFQYIRVDGFAGSLGDIPVGEVHTQVLGVHVDYFLTDRLILAAGIPFVRERYLGPFDHDPLALDPPRTNVENVDLGDWNTDFQDFHLGLRYVLTDSPLVIEPYIYAGVPSSDYPFFGRGCPSTVW